MSVHVENSLLLTSLRTKLMPHLFFPSLKRSVLNGMAISAIQYVSCLLVAENHLLSQLKVISSLDEPVEIKSSDCTL